LSTTSVLAAGSVTDGFAVGESLFKSTEEGGGEASGAEGLGSTKFEGIIMLVRQSLMSESAIEAIEV
jgi:hypothetical protein